MTDGGVLSPHFVVDGRQSTGNVGRWELLPQLEYHLQSASRKCSPNDQAVRVGTKDGKTAVSIARRWTSLVVENEGEMNSEIFVFILSCSSPSSKDSRHLQRSNQVGLLNLFDFIPWLDLIANGFLKWLYWQLYGTYVINAIGIWNIHGHYEESIDWSGFFSSWSLDIPSLIISTP